MRKFIKINLLTLNNERREVEYFLSVIPSLGPISQMKLFTRTSIGAFKTVKEYLMTGKS